MRSVATLVMLMLTLALSTSGRAAVPVLSEQLAAGQNSGMDSSGDLSVKQNWLNPSPTDPSPRANDAASVPAIIPVKPSRPAPADRAPYIEPGARVDHVRPAERPGL